MVKNQDKAGILHIKEGDGGKAEGKKEC